MKFRYSILIFFIFSFFLSFSQSDNITVHGFIYDLKNGKKLKALVKVFEENTLKQTILSDTIEGYRFKVSAQKKYGLLVTSDYYCFAAETIEINDDNYSNDITKDIGLGQIDISIDYRIKNVYFDKNSSVIRLNDSLVLQQINDFLMEYPEISFEINGNCDSDEVKNERIKIDEVRAKEIYGFFIRKGIDKNRLRYKGFKDQNPIASNETEEGKAMNRRVDFYIDIKD